MADATSVAILANTIKGRIDKIVRPNTFHNFTIYVICRTAC